MDVIALIEKYFLLFIVYSACGWIIEEVYCSILEKKIVNRGFLIGPLCPIYGFGGLGITLVLMGINKYPILVFISAVLLSGILEYFTSYILEKMFHARWWDYSERRFNLNGRICVRTLIPFGLFGLAVIYILTPLIFKCMNSIPNSIVNVIAILIFITFVIDTIISMKVVSKVTQKIKKVKTGKTKDNTDEISELVTSELQKTKLGKRLLDAFPDLTAVKEKIKEAAEKGKAVAKGAVEKSKVAVKNSANKVKKEKKQ